MRKFAKIGFLVGLVLTIFLWSSHLQLAITILILSLLIYLLFNLYGSLYLSSNYFVPAFTTPEVSDSKNAILTFDDGPNEQTREILNVLARHGCPATFFVIGKNIKNNTTILNEIDTAGHIIGNHSFWHRPNFPIQFSAHIQTELKKTNILIEKTIGKKPRFFRPPFGAMSPFLAHAIRKINMNVIGWNIRSFDTKNNLEKTLKRVKHHLRDQSNVIILLHDSTENIAALLDSIIIYLKENNYKIIPLSDAIKQAAYDEN